MTIVPMGEDIRLDSSEVRFDYDELLEGSISIERLKAAQGGLLPGYAPENSEAYVEWLAAYRAQTILCICRALSKEIHRAKSVGDWLGTEQVARACLALEPTHEEATLALAETLAASGSKAQAMSLLDQYVRDLGPSRAQLQVSATVLRRRISERVPDVYRSGLTLPFLGRDAEMTTLSEHFELARSGESHCVAIVGDAGIGKTRLAEEFCTQAALKGARVERVVTQPHDTHRPMATFADLVPRLLNLPGALGCSPESIAALKRLTANDAETSSPTTHDLPSEVVASGISRAIADLIDAIATEATLVLIVDDVQWADDLSRRAIATLVSARQSRRLLVILTSRDRSIVQYFARHAERLKPISLAPLTSSSVSGIIDRLLDVRELAVDEELFEWLMHSSGGNPFFLRCLVSHVQSTGERFVVPSTISSLLDQQLATLGPEAFSVLSMCVTLGRHSTIDHIVEALGISHLHLQTALRELESSHLIAQSGFRIEPTHWLIAESVARTTSPIARKVLHRQAATVLEREREDSDAASRLWDCAEHWILADEQARAAKAINTCADYSVEIGRPREAAESLLRAASIVAKNDAIALATRAMRLSDMAGEVDIVLRAADQVRELGGRVEDSVLQLAEALARNAGDEKHDESESLRMWLTSDKPLELRVRAALAIVVSADHNNNPDSAIFAFASLADAVNLDRSATDVSALTFLLMYHSLFGDIDTSVEAAERLLGLSRGLDEATSAFVERKCAVAFCRAGHVSRSIELLTSAYRKATSSGLTRLQCHTASMLAGFCADLCNDRASSEWRKKMDAVADQLTGFSGSIQEVSVSAELDWNTGNFAGAREAYDRLRTAKTPTTKTKRWMRVLDARLAQLEKRPGDAQETAKQMIEHHLPNNESSDLGDSEIAVAVHALVQGGFEDQARALLTRYVAVFRRVRGPFTRALQDALKPLSWIEPPSFVQSFDWVALIPPDPVTTPPA
ncbi:MAG TPA: AAA family ATPase [Gemmatimonadaceae bacterium]